MADKISVDLGIVNRNDYYTGIVFQGYVQGLGARALVGGRYDRLLSEYGLDLPAVGFGIEVDALAKLIPPEKPNKKTVLIFAKEGFELKGLDALHDYTNADFSLEETLEDALQQAKTQGYQTLVLIGEEIKEVTV